MEEKRVFLAVNLPENIKQEIAQEQGEIDNLFPEGMGPDLIRWTKQDNVHITLLFLGSLKEETILQLSNVIRKITEGQKKFSLRLEKIAYGPPGKIPPRMIWLYLKENQELEKLAKEIKRKVLQDGILRKDDKKSFSPHITLARIKTWQWKRIEPEERPHIERTLNREYQVKSIELMESKLKRGGAEYKTLESFNLE
jgi:RNA 2',3'-cyclic 3'-phosphodiesterase